MLRIAFSVLLLCSLMWHLNAFKENEKFCINTKPTLSNDIEENVDIIESESICEVVATTLTVKEKDSFHNTICKEQESSEHKDAFYFFKLHNGVLTGRSSHQEICNSKVNPLLGWISYKTFQQHYAHQLNPKEHMNYIARATDAQRDKSELCHFRHADLVNEISDNLFTCVVMIYEDNFYGLESNINVLVEIQPLMYEIRNVTHLPNSTSNASYKTLLGRTELRNPSNERRHVRASLSYRFVEKIQLNTSTVYREDMAKLPLLYEHVNGVLELDDQGAANVEVKEKASFGRKLSPKTMVKVDVIGQWTEVRRQFTADIYEYFGYGIKRFRQELSGGEVTFVRIESTEPVYEVPEKTDALESTAEMSAAEKFGKLTLEEDSFKMDNGTETYHGADEDFATWAGEEFLGGPPSTDDHPYPDFYPWFVMGALLVGIVLLVAVIALVRTCSKQEQRKKYKFTGI